MTIAAEKEHRHIGEAAGCADHDHDLVQDLSRRLDFLWRVEQFIANAEGDADLQKHWAELKKQESRNAQRTKELIKAHIEKDCF